MQPVAIIYLGDAMHLPHRWSTGLLIPFQLAALVGLWLWNQLADRMSRFKALLFGGSLWITLCLVATVLPGLDGDLSPWASANRMPLILLISAVLGLGLGASTAYLLPWTFLPDAVDLQPGNPAVLITAFKVQIQKLGSALSVFALGLLLSWSRYLAPLGPAQPQSALVMIRLCMGLVPAVLVVMALWLMKGWDPRLKPISEL